MIEALGGGDSTGPGVRLEMGEWLNWRPGWRPCARKKPASF